jgi:guanylate kinase
MMMGPLFIVSGPSGSGKSTVVARVLAYGDLPLRRSVSATTRQRRDGEVDGVHYYFWARERFEKALQAGAFLESAEVHGAYYGTLESEVTPYRQQGVGVILVIDVKGFDQVRQKVPDVVSVFVHAPSLEALAERLRGRGTETEASRERRLAAAAREEARSGDYAYEVLNDDLAAAVVRLHEIVRGEFERGSHVG